MEKKEGYLFYSSSVQDVLTNLKTSPEGLSKDEPKKRLTEFGYNEILDKNKQTALKMFFGQFKNSIIYVLLFAAGVSIFVGEMLEFYVILALIMSCVLLSFFEEYKAAKDMEALKNMTPSNAKVLRDGGEKQIPTRELVYGDIILLDRGDKVPADARILELNGLKVDESILTGESAAVPKNNVILPGNSDLAGQINMLFSGTQVITGNAKAVVVKTAMDTEIGKISAMIKEVKEEKTPLQKRLDSLSKELSIIVVVLCAILFVMGLVRGEKIVVMLITSIAVAVSGIPESLPTVVAVTLATGVKRMAHKNAIVKKLPAVETLGETTVICTDKTGTLTENKMIIEKIFTLDAEMDITGKGFTPEGLFLQERQKVDPKKHKTVSKLLEIGVLCNNAKLEKKENYEFSISGEVTEGSLIVLAEKAGVKRDTWHEQFKRVKEHPFDPDRKCMSTVHLVNKKHIVYAKGAPEMLIRKCKYYFAAGKVKHLDKKIKDIIAKKNHEFAEKGLRVLALCFKELNHKDMNNINHVESDLVFVGLVSIRDPPKESAISAIKLCKQAGTKVVMITGDNPVTAKAIGKELNIFEENKNKIVTGPELDSMGDDEFLQIIEDVSIFARVTPAHKLRIVTCFQRKGHVVAMTGDGVNDAPALKKADIGIAMGLRGTDVAKEAANIILKDDNFATIVSAIQEGRTIYENARKFIYFLLTGNLSEVILFVIAILLGMPLPLTALMILYLNLVTSDVPALGLSMEKTNPEIMKQKPRDPKEGILNEFLLLKVAQSVPFVVLGTLILFMVEIVVNKTPFAKAQTIAFATLIFFELFHVLNCRSWKDSIFDMGLFSNPYIVGGLSISALLTIGVIYIPSAQQIFGTVSLNWGDWMRILLVSGSILFFTEISKVAINTEIKEREKYELEPGNSLVNTPPPKVKTDDY